MPRKRPLRDRFECDPDEAGGARELDPANIDHKLPATDGNVDAWNEEGSDQLMDFEVLARVKRAGIEADLERARKIARRAE